MFDRVPFDDLATGRLPDWLPADCVGGVHQMLDDCREVEKLLAAAGIGPLVDMEIACDA